MVWRMLADDCKAYDLTRGEVGWNSMPVELLNLRKWAICSGDGCFTYPHIDGSGLLTWMMVHEGTKLWTYYTMTSGRKSSEDQPEHTPFENFTEVLNSVHDYASAADILPARLVPHHLILRPGSLLSVIYWQFVSYCTDLSGIFITVFSPRE